MNTRGHTAKIVKNRCHLDLRLFFFSQRVIIDRWNGLQQEVIDLTSVNVFNNGLEKTRITKMGFFKN